MTALSAPIAFDANDNARGQDAKAQAARDHSNQSTLVRISQSIAVDAVDFAASAVLAVGFAAGFGYIAAQ